MDFQVRDECGRHEAAGQAAPADVEYAHRDAHWIDIGTLADIPRRGARTVRIAREKEIAIFRTGDDHVFALVNECPHKKGPLSQGIVHGHSVACPLHNWTIALDTGEAQGADHGCTPTIAVRRDGDRILIAQPRARKAAA
ncbi:nitrite reductase (NADH) small subunit [Sphingobium sp. OAS761]|uniref:nitrite reductase small subunit NirD n=1 Tax=Sphingobium sp. OAS761 TaxID=2817901 RepID=UPI00209C9613|nr:nitrite reductase small subunit NirD [Sphingobium sp. OAS761]MCP1471539.1 nitrite reductase (NADH) small subunit [Sphingobium sp. OAS761]